MLTPSSNPAADVADGMLPATPAAAAVGLVTRTRTRGEAGWMSDDSEVSDGGDAFSPRAGFAVPCELPPPPAVLWVMLTRTLPAVPALRNTSMHERQREV